MPRLHRAGLAALTIGLAACATPAPLEPVPLIPEPAAATATSAPDTVGPLDEALDVLVASATGRFRLEIVLDLGDDPEAEALGPVVDGIEGAFDRASGRWTVGPLGGPAEVHDGAFLADPSAMAEVLRSADPLVADGGQAVRGVPADVYRTTVHLDRVLGRVADARRALVGAELDDLADLLEEFGASPASDAIDARVWLAGDGGLLRLELLVPIAAGTFGSNASARLTLDLYDYGTAIVIEPPGGPATP